MERKGCKAFIFLSFKFLESSHKKHLSTNMKKRILVVAAVTISSQLFAQEDTSTNRMDEVVVTATKFSRKSAETGKVVTVISRETLERSTGKDLAQLLNEQTGIIINGANSNPGKDKSLYMRGAKTDHTLILIDGIPVYDPSGLNSNFDIRMLPIEIIQRVEILKGSQSTLYGSDAIAGVINIITKKGGDKKIGAFASTAYGSYNTFKSNVGMSGKTNLFDYNVAYNYFSTKGISEAADRTGATKLEKDGYDQHGLMANLGIKVTDKWKISPYLRYSSFDGALDSDGFKDDPDYTYKSKNTQAGVRSETKFGKGTLAVNYSLNTIRRDYLNDSAKTGELEYLKGNYKGVENFGEAVYSTSLCKSVSLVAGVDFRTSNTTQDALSKSIWGDYPTNINKDSAKQNQFSQFASLLYNGGIFHAEAGVRYNHHSTYGGNWTYNFNPFMFLNKEVKVFANISSAFKTPTLYQQYAPYIGNHDLKPEYATTYEGGIQYFHPSNLYTLRTVVFQRKMKDAIAFTSGYINQDKQNDWGFEVEQSINPTDKVQLMLNYAFVDGEITTKKNGKDTTYFNLLRRPKHSFGATLNYTISKSVFVSAGARTIGKRTDMDFAAYSEVILPTYTLFNLYGEYKINKSFKLFVDAKNLTDKDYTEIFGYSTQGFNLMGGISWKL